MARRKNAKSVNRQEQAWCENQVAHVWRLYLVSGDPGEKQAKVKFRAEMVLATCLAVKEPKRTSCTSLFCFVSALFLFCFVLFSHTIKHCRVPPCSPEDSQHTNRYLNQVSREQCKKRVTIYGGSCWCSPSLWYFQVKDSLWWSNFCLFSCFYIFGDFQWIYLPWSCPASSLESAFFECLEPGSHYVI